MRKHKYVFTFYLIFRHEDITDCWNSLANKARTSHFTMSISLLLMTWRCQEPGYQYPWYWPSFPTTFWAPHGHKNIPRKLGQCHACQCSCSFYQQFMTNIPGSNVLGANMGLTGSRWAPCWLHEPCYLGWYAKLYEAGACLNINMSSYQNRNSHYQIRRSHDCLIFIMEILYTWKDHLYIEIRHWCFYFLPSGFQLPKISVCGCISYANK